MDKYCCYETSTIRCKLLSTLCAHIVQAGLAVVNDKLYAVGGFDGHTYLKSVEVFDTDTNQWRLYGRMTYRLVTLSHHQSQMSSEDWVEDSESLDRLTLTITRTKVLFPHFQQTSASITWHSFIVQRTN